MAVKTSGFIIRGKMGYLYRGTPDEPAQAVEVSEGLFKFPGWLNWKDENSGQFLFKPEFHMADKELGYGGYQGGPAFLAIAQHLAHTHELARDVRATMLNMNRPPRDIYALGQTMVAEILGDAEAGRITVTGLMSEKRFMVVRAVLGGISMGIDDIDNIEGIETAMEAIGLRPKRQELETAELLPDEAKDWRQIVTLTGCLALKLGQGTMTLQRPSFKTDLQEGVVREGIAGPNGWEAIVGYEI